jgi:NADP-dependent 3-hydroxy acid dehydrogenase YdfG
MGHSWLDAVVVHHPHRCHQGRPRRKAGEFVMEPADVAKVAVLMASLPPEVNLYEATILPNHSRSFISRG